MRSGCKRLLIVDPHPDVLMELQKAFEDAGFDTETAWTGGDAIRLLHRGRFDVALVSDYLPDANCNVLGQIIRAGNMPVVIMQAAAEAMNSRDDLLACGASAVVCKHDLTAVKKAIGEAIAVRTARSPRPTARTPRSRMERVGSVG